MPVNPALVFGLLSGGGGPAPSHGAGPGALGALAGERRAQGYLDLNREQNEFGQQMRVTEMHEKERSKRQQAMLALNQAVRTGVKADILSAAQQARALGLEVDLDPDFMSSVKPEELPQLPSTPEGQADDLGFTLDEWQPGEKELGQAAQSAARTVAELGAPPPVAPPVAPAPFVPTRPDGTPIPQQPPAGPPAGPPLGPGMGMPQPKPRGYRVRDPLYGGEFSIMPEEIIAEQKGAVSAAFAPAEGVGDPIYVQGRNVGAQMAESLIGLVPLDEAIARGEKAEALYNANMLKQLGIEAAGQRRKGGGGGGAAKPDFASPGTKEAGQLVGGLSDNIMNAIKETKSSEGYAKNVQAHQLGEQTLGKLSLNMGVADRGAVGDYIKSISGAAATDKERAWYTGAAGLWSQLQNKANYLTSGGKLDEKLISDLRKMIQQAQSRLAGRQEQILEQGWQGAKAEVDLWLSEYGVADSDRRLQYYNKARRQLGLRPLRPKKKPATEASAPASADEQAKGLL